MTMINELSISFLLMVIIIPLLSFLLYYDTIYKLCFLYATFIYKPIIKYKYNNCKYTSAYMKHMVSTLYSFNNYSNEEEISFSLFNEICPKLCKLLKLIQINMIVWFIFVLFIILFPPFISFGLILLFNIPNIEQYTELAVCYSLPIFSLMVFSFHLIIKIKILSLCLIKVNKRVKDRLVSTKENLKMYNVNFFENDLLNQKLDYDYESTILEENFLTRYIKDFYNTKEIKQDFKKLTLTLLDYLSKKGLPENIKICSKITEKENYDLNIIEFLVDETKDRENIKDILKKLFNLGVDFYELRVHRHDSIWLKELKREALIKKEEEELNNIINNKLIVKNKSRL